VVVVVVVVTAAVVVVAIVIVNVNVTIIYIVYVLKRSLVPFFNLVETCEVTFLTQVTDVCEQFRKDSRNLRGQLLITCCNNKGV
jgi:hypothetical protein